MKVENGILLHLVFGEVITFAEVVAEREREKLTFLCKLRRGREEAIENH